MNVRIKSVEDLGLLVRASRKAAKLRLDDTAACCNVGHVFLRELEHGKTTLQIGKVFQILDELGIHLQADVLDEVIPALAQVREKGLRPLTPRKRD